MNPSASLPPVRLSAVMGALVGLAAGDRIGGPLQFALRLAGSLRDNREFVPDDVFRRYLQWHREGSFDTGEVALWVFRLADTGMSGLEAAIRADRQLGGMTAGCNPAHRAAPLAMSATLADDALAMAAGTEAALTHRHPLAGDAAAAVAVLCRALMRGLPWEKALGRAAEGRLPEIRQALEAGPRESLKTGGFAPDTLRAAIHFVGQADHFQEALEASLEFAGPPNYAPVLVGSIGGARWGLEAIPDFQLRHCPVLAQVRRMARDLGQAWEAP